MPKRGTQMSLPILENTEQMCGCAMSVYEVQRVHHFAYKRVAEAYESMVI